MAAENRPSKAARSGRQVIGFIPVFVLLGIFAMSAVIALEPAFGSETDKFRAAVYETDRTIFTTYFYSASSAIGCVSFSSTLRQWWWESCSAP
jgi:hypothetical protein